MGWDISSINANQDLMQQIEQDLTEYLPEALERNYGPQPLSNGELIPIVEPGELGNYSPRTRELVVRKYNYSGVFRLVSGCQNGTNVMASAIDTMRVVLQMANGEIRVCTDAIDAFTSGAEQRVLGMSDANALARGWKAYIEANGYAGSLVEGLQGLLTLPFGDYLFPAAMSTMTAEVILDNIQLAIAAHQAVFADSDLKILALGTRQYNLLKSKRLIGSSQSVMKAFLDENPDFLIIKVPSFDGLDAGADVAFLLPNDPEQLALVVDESVKLDAYNEKGNLVIRGRVATALVVAKNPFCGIRLRGI